MAYGIVNKTGCTVRKGNCQIRIDFFLEPADPRYADRYLYLVDTTSPEYLAGYPGELNPDGTPVDQAAYDDWWASLPRVWTNTPFHSHFIYLPATFTEQDIKDKITLHLPNFYAAFQDRWDEIPGGMRHGWDTKTRIRPKDYSKTDTPAEYAARVDACQAALDALTEISDKPRVEGGGTFPATLIDIGHPAEYDANDIGVPSYTYLTLYNPANATGSLDTIEMYIHTAVTTGITVGTLYGSGTSYTSRDYQALGNFSTGYQTTGCDIDVEAGDFIGFYSTTGRLKRRSGNGVYRKSGDQFGAGAQTYTLVNASYSFSLYGTGDTGAAPTAQLSAPMGAKMIAGKMI